MPKATNWLFCLLTALAAVACGPMHRDHAGEEQTGPSPGGLVEGTRVPVSLAHFHVHPGRWNGRQISNGCPSRMYRETTAIAVYSRAAGEELFQFLKAIDPLATAVDPWPVDSLDSGVRAYALIFRPESVSDRTSEDRTMLETEIQTLVEEHDVSHIAIAVSRSGEADDARRFGFTDDDDIVIAVSRHGIVHSTYRLGWEDVTADRIAETIALIRDSLN